MKAKVIALHSGEVFTDKQPRVTLRVEKCDSGFNEIRFRNTINLELDQEVEVKVNLLVKAETERNDNPHEFPRIDMVPGAHEENPTAG